MCSYNSFKPSHRLHCVNIMFWQRVQCGDHYTVSSTDQSEIYYWGLRFKDPTGSNSAQPPRGREDSESRSSVGEGGANRDDMRIESVTPRNASHSRQPSTASAISIEGLKDNGKDGELCLVIAVM